MISSSLTHQLLTRRTFEMRLCILALFLSLAASNSWAQPVKQAVQEAVIQAAQSGDNFALQELTAAAALGDAPAQNALGRMYFLGEGVTADHPYAAMWYSLSAFQLDPIGKQWKDLIEHTSPSKDLGKIKDLLRGWDVRPGTDKILSSKMALAKSRDFLKRGQPIVAAELLLMAATKNPADKQVQKELLEVGKNAAALAFSASRAVKSPAETGKWLEKAISYDPSNLALRTGYKELQERSQEAAGLIQEALRDAKNGEDIAATAKLKAAVTFKIQNLQLYEEAEQEAHASATARRMKTLWDAGNVDESLRELAALKLGLSPDAFASRVSRTIRSEAAQKFLAQAASIPNTAELHQMVQREALLKRVMDLEPSDAAARMTIEARSSLGERLKATVTDLGFKSPVLRRRALQHVSTLAIDTSLKKSTSELNSLPLDFAVTGLQKCVQGPSEATLRSEFERGLRLSKSDEEIVPGLHLLISNFSCASADQPKQRSEKVNSTIVVGYNQLANPEYLQTSNELASAQAELNRASVQNTANPNFASGFAMGLARGRVNRLRSALGAMSPFTSSPIIQPYQYEGFIAARAFEISADLHIEGESYSATVNVVGRDEDSGKGIVGVLATDNTGAKDIDPGLRSLDAITSSANSRFLSSLLEHARPVVAGYFSMLASDPLMEPGDRVGAMLYAIDSNNDGNSTDTLITGFNAALLSNEAALKTFAKGLNMPFEKQNLRSGSTHTSVEPSTVIPLERIVQGVTAIETDTGTSGSGFFVGLGCLVITNEHVVHGASSIVLRTAGKGLYIGHVVVADADRDLALLSTNAVQCSPLTLGDRDDIAIGAEVFAIGNPLGLEGSVSKGIVSAIRDLSDGGHYIQIDASLNPGNSGGPLTNRAGKVIGVNTFKLKGYENLNFAVSIVDVRAILGAYLK